jgi:hypothetical protein
MCRIGRILKGRSAFSSHGRLQQICGISNHRARRASHKVVTFQGLGTLLKWGLTTLKKAGFRFSVL